MADTISEIKKLCAEIKRLVPPNKPKDPTGQFGTFIKNLESQNIKSEEIDSIHRAYNYFNCLIATQETKPDAVQEKSLPSSSSSTSTSTTTTTTTHKSLEPKPTPTPTPDEQKEMIEILLELGKHLNIT
jgi:cell division septation protein DedD